MAVRIINYTVNADGITPNGIQFGGVQKDHKATQIDFCIDDIFYQNLINQAGDGKLIYRFDGYNGEGAVAMSDTYELNSLNLSYPLEEWITRYGGLIKVVLVISVYANNSTKMELYSFPAMISIKSLPYVNEKEYESMSTLGEIAKEAVTIATKAKDVSVAAMNDTVAARTALEKGTEWVFDGGNATDTVSVDFAVDTAMSDISTNPIANKTAKNYIDAEISDVLGNFDSIKDYVVEQGYENGWVYRKWSSGVAECSIVKNVEGVLENKSGAFSYMSLDENKLFFPSGMFIDTCIPTTQVTAEEEKGNIFLTKTLSSSVSVGLIYLYAWVAENYELKNCKIHIHAIGRWK